MKTHAVIAIKTIKDKFKGFFIFKIKRKKGMQEHNNTNWCLKTERSA